MLRALEQAMMSGREGDDVRAGQACTLQVPEVALRFRVAGLFLTCSTWGQQDLDLICLLICEVPQRPSLMPGRLNLPVLYHPL